MANITPPKGVLKAAAMPAAPPAIIKPWSEIWDRWGNQRLAWCITPAAIWTDGPSRPSESPASMPQLVSSILATVSRIDTNRLRSALETSGVNAAITCGMPDPAAPGANRRVSHTMAAVEAGIQSMGPHQNAFSKVTKCSNACSVIQVKATTVKPASAAKARTTPRPAHKRQSYSSSWMAEKTGD